MNIAVAHGTAPVIAPVHPVSALPEKYTPLTTSAVMIAIPVT